MMESYEKNFKFQIQQIQDLQTAWIYRKSPFAELQDLQRLITSALELARVSITEYRNKMYKKFNEASSKYDL